MSIDLSAATSLLGTEGRLTPPPFKAGMPEGFDLLEVIEDGFIYADRAWRFAFVNGKAARLLRYDRDQLLGRSVWEVLPSILGDEAETHLRRAVAERISMRFEAHDVQAEAWLEISAHPYGEGLVAFLADVTERKLAEGTLLAKEARLRALFDQQFQYTALLSPEGILLDINEYALKSTGLAREDVVGRPFWATPWWGDLPEARQGWPERLKLASLSNEPVIGETSFFAKGELRYAETAVTAVRVEDRVDFFLVQGHDITELRRAARDLTQAYEATLEGWTRTLDARDHETQGHSKRVAELTVRLARRLGYPEAGLVHLQRGALLHDIGKMGVPDAVLRKPGPLDEPEREVMRSHPELAKEMLEPIGFLSAALDIPYYHHERWNGAGYPLGLRGHEIPWSARIFAVVDVYDALTSDRPYRKAWSQSDALSYIGLQAGIHFDPEVVEAFLEMCEEDEV